MAGAGPPAAADRGRVAAGAGAGRAPRRRPHHADRLQPLAPLPADGAAAGGGASAPDRLRVRPGPDRVGGPSDPPGRGGGRPDRVLQPPRPRLRDHRAPAHVRPARPAALRRGLDDRPRGPGDRRGRLTCRPWRRPDTWRGSILPAVEIAGTSALVTGGASGLGRATAELLLERGARVVIFDLPASAGAEVARELGAAATFVPGDVTSEEDARAAVAAAGDLRIAVNCAGIGSGARIVGRDGPYPLERFRRVIEVNLVGTFNVL